VTEKLDKSLNDFIAGTATGVAEANKAWLTFLRKELNDASEALDKADPLAEEETQTPSYLAGWMDAIDYLIHRANR